MEEDEKEIEINVGGDRVEGRSMENWRERTEQNTIDFSFSCLIFLCKSVSKLRKKRKDKMS